MDTKAIADAIVKKYKTRNPFDIANEKNILIIYEPLGSIFGYYNRCYKQNFIHINQELDGFDATFTCAHELGHVVLHPKVNTPFLRKHTMLPVSRLENEANHFAVDLLFDDNELFPLLEQPIAVATSYLGVPENLAKYRLNSVQK